MALNKNKPIAPPAGGKRVFAKAADFGTPGLLVLGKSGSGRSTVARDQLVADKVERVLWLYSNNVGAFVNLPEETARATSSWDFLQIPDWDEFKGIVREIKNGELEYDAVVVDGGGKLSRFALQKIAGETAPSQPQWFQVSNELHSSFIDLASKVKQFIVVLDVVNGAEGKNEVDLNRYALNQIVTLFSRKWYTSVTKRRSSADPKAPATVFYGVQTNPALALELIPQDAS